MTVTPLLQKCCNEVRCPDSGLTLLTELISGPVEVTVLPYYTYIKVYISYNTTITSDFSKAWSRYFKILVPLWFIAFGLESAMETSVSLIGLLSIYPLGVLVSSVLSSNSAS